MTDQPTPAGSATPKILTTHLDYGVMVLPDCTCDGDLRLLGPNEAICKACEQRYAITVTLTTIAAASEPGNTEAGQ